MQVQHQINRILSGIIACKVGNKTVEFISPSPYLRVEADRVEHDAFVDLRYYGVMTRDEMLELMMGQNLWSMQKEQQYQSLPKLMETLKLQMWQFHEKFASKRVEQTRKTLKKHLHTFKELSLERNRFDTYTAEGCALIQKLDHIIYNTIQIDIKPRSIDFYIGKYICSMLSDDAIRSLSKSAEWRSMWIVGKNTQLFGVGLPHMNSEQRMLIHWSKFYDGIYESMDCPSEEVIQDNDLIDGWLIAQHNKREQERNEKHGGSHSKPGMQEVYIPAESPEDAARIDAMNDPNAKLIKKQRLQLVKELGRVSEDKMPDSQLTMRQQAIRDFQRTVKGK